MKKRNLKALVAGLLAGVMVIGTAAAAATNAYPEPATSDWTFVVNGQKVDFSGIGFNGNNYVKLRDILKALNMGVEYDVDTKTVTVNRYENYEDESPVGPAPQAYASQAPYKTNTLPQSDPNYWQTEWETQVYNYKLVRNYPTLYVKSAWDAAQNAGNLMLNIDPAALTDANKGQILAARDAIADLANNQIKPYSDGINGEVIYIWDADNMPTTTSAEDLASKYKMVTYDGSEPSYDSPDFVPYIIPYLLDDPTTAKGNIVVLSGGGNSSRSNPNEGYRVAPGFNALGYNCFLLQRRVAPYNNTDIVMDLQRAIRYVKYYGEAWGLGSMDVIATAGFSGGAANVCDQIETFYGNITPDQFDPSYVCDAIDAVNSDVNVAMPIYSGGPLETENPNIPHIFQAVGADDFLLNPAISMFQQLKSDPQFAGVETELQIYAMNGHGFGGGNAGTTSMLWMQAADMFIQKVMGKVVVNFKGEIPAEYTQTQSFVYGGFPIGETTVNAYITADRGKVLFTFFGWGDNIMVECLLIGGRVADVVYDSVGYFSGDAPALWEMCDQSAWTARN